ncbi:hypothetical protein [Pseudomonas putida]|uniref:hypothetical protein n=1 Tax=Pseudomonas putida TaxID=303 RepID=UPI0013AF5112|nr:hypothetical protein [Pseudomonas putida]
MDDKVIWTGCGLLFLSGVVWGSNINSPSFFIIPNIHDLFDILGSIATIIAVILAAVGLNRWRVELGAASDHELARRMAVALSRYRTEIINLWHYADSASTQNDSEHWIRDKDAFEIGVYDHARAQINAARAQIDPIVLECDAIWDDIFKNDLAPIFQIENLCVNTVSTYLYLSHNRPVTDEHWQVAAASVKTWQDFKSSTTHNYGTFETKLDNLLTPIKKNIGKKLISKHKS